MLLRSFFLNVLIRVCLIAISSILMGIVLHYVKSGYYYTLAGMLLLIAIQTYLLILDVNRTNTDLERFLSAVTDEDSSIRFSKNINDRSFIALRKKMDDLNTMIQKIKLANEKSHQYLQTVVDHVDIGLLSFNKDEQIEIYNKTARMYVNHNRLSSLKMKNPEFYSLLTDIKPGQEILHRFKIDNQLQSLLLKAREIKYEDQVIKLISFENITRELDRKEQDSWHRLIRILTHEIMNSVSPITSLTSVISGYYKKKENNETKLPGELTDVIISKTLDGLNTIEETGKGLLEFVNKYRSLTTLPKPELSRFPVTSLLTTCKLLMETSIDIRIKVNPPDLEMSADYSQVEQVIINLIKNAAEAMKGNNKGFVCLSASSDESNLAIRVEDNGPGIQENIAEDIFVPFFTTKPNGSGIGLSLSKQIMQSHNGTITLESVKGCTAFTLKFPLE